MGMRLDRNMQPVWPIHAQGRGAGTHNGANIPTHTHTRTDVDGHTDTYQYTGSGGYSNR